LIKEGVQDKWPFGSVWKLGIEEFLTPRLKRRKKKEIRIKMKAVMNL